MTTPGPGARIVGLGGAAGDDAVGLEVVEALRRTGVGPGVELHQITDPVQLMPLLEGRGRIVLVDAVLQPPAGRVLDLTPADLARLPAAPASSHGLSPLLAIELARQLGPGPGPSVAIVAVTIDAPPAGRIGLSPAVARAIPVAVEHVLAAVARLLRPRSALPSGAMHRRRPRGYSGCDGRTADHSRVDRSVRRARGPDRPAHHLSRQPHRTLVMRR